MNEQWQPHNRISELVKGPIPSISMQKSPNRPRNLDLPSTLVTDNAEDLMETCKVGMVPISRTKMLPVVITAASRDRMFDIFMSSLEAMQGDFAVMHVFEFDNAKDDGKMTTTYADKSVVQSKLPDHEEILREDAQFGLVVATGQFEALKLEPNKLIYAHSTEIDPYLRIARQNGIFRLQNVKMITDYPYEFKELKNHADLFSRFWNDFACYENDDDEGDFAGSGVK